MSVTLKYHVHRVNSIESEREVTFKDVQTVAKVPGLEVELTHESAGMEVGHGSMTLRFVGSEVEAARATFIQDADVNMTFVLVPESVPTPVTTPPEAAEAAETPVDAEPVPASA